jgi:hypothetical protein
VQPAPEPQVTPTDIPVTVSTSSGETIIPVVITSTSQPVVPDPSVKVIIPPVQPKPTTQTAPIKAPWRLSDLIVWILLNIKKLWRK